jgi:hypothetical protein
MAKIRPLGALDLSTEEARGEIHFACNPVLEGREGGLTIADKRAAGLCCLLAIFCATKRGRQPVCPDGNAGCLLVNSAGAPALKSYSPARSGFTSQEFYQLRVRFLFAQIRALGK